MREARNLRASAGISSGRKVRFVLREGEPLDQDERKVLGMLLQAGPLSVEREYDPAPGTPSADSRFGILYLPLEGLIDFGAQEARLEKECARIQAEIGRARARLENPSFAGNAPARVVEEHRRRLEDWERKLAHARGSLEATRAARSSG